MNFDAIADIFDAVFWQIETVTPFLQSDFTVAVSVTSESMGKKKQQA